MTKSQLIILFFLILTQSLSGQEGKERHYVQIDGIVTDNTGLPVRYVNIISRILGTGSDTDERGIFSIISMNGDTLIFTSIGFKPSGIRIPGNISGSKFSVDLVMEIDTINIGSVLVLPWKTYDEFKRAVIEYVPPEEEMMQNMLRNMAIMQGQIFDNLDITPEAGHRYAMQIQAEEVMTRNQTPVNNILNPFAWSKFIKGVKSGLLKNKKSDRKKNRQVKKSKKRKDKSGEN